MMFLALSYRYLKRFVVFWKEFLIGDDWWGAGSVLVGLGLTYLAVHENVAAWWVPIVFVIASLAQNLVRAHRRVARTGSEAQPAAPPKPSGDADPGRRR